MEKCAEYDQPLPVTQYGCLPLHEYFWYNSGHMSVTTLFPETGRMWWMLNQNYRTTHVHKILSKEVEKFLTASSA